MEFITENGRAVCRIGQGTWYLGENAATAARERKALQAGVEAGMNLIDTAEMYGEGAAEHLIGSAIRGMGRASLYLVSKVYPFNADRRSIFLSVYFVLPAALAVVHDGFGLMLVRQLAGGVPDEVFLAIAVCSVVGTLGLLALYYLLCVRECARVLLGEA